ncbi:hypothetical protein KIN20_019382 [Parelaphostrongylus tenuis]|uniref:C6 domain-containing protein n=1 Tax=Parelaphostrongylus tenuis TaxID=148309 RepID=A0AAD5MKX9_PARTN|nr:hypothetical protein KIN20_019382 [Parelaphostrongylus tenuis]
MSAVLASLSKNLTVNIDSFKQLTARIGRLRSGEIATLYANGNLPLKSGRGRILSKISCNSDVKWVTESNVVILNVSCIVQKYGKKSTSPNLPSQPPATTSRPSPGLEPCMVCPKVSVIALTAIYTNGFITQVSSTNGECETVQLTCQGNKDDDELVWLINGKVYQEGVGVLKMTLLCNKMMKWTTSNGWPVLYVSCGVKTKITLSPKRSTTTTSITTTTTPTAAPTQSSTVASKCYQCPNLQPQAVESLGSNEENGILVSEYYTGSNRCRAADIRCYAYKGYGNATLIIIGESELTLAPIDASISLMCSPYGQWMMVDKKINSASCRITRSPENKTASVSFMIPTSTTTSTKSGTDERTPCSSCDRMLVTNAPTGYKNGFVMMNTYYNGSCINGELTCSSPDNMSKVAWIGSLGESHTDFAVKTILKLTCNEQAKWLTPSGATVGTLSCVKNERIIREDTLTSLGSSTITIPTTTAIPTATTISTATTIPSTTTILTATTIPTVTTIPTMVPTAIVCESSKWSEWKDWSNCTDTCGACGTMQRFRECVNREAGCTCDGNSTETQVCNKEVCMYPRTSCCQGYAPASYAGKFYCMEPT